MPRDVVHVSCPACGRSCAPKDLNIDEAGNVVDEPVAYGVFVNVQHLLGRWKGITWTKHNPSRAIVLGIRAQLVRAIEYVDTLLADDGES